MMNSSPLLILAPANFTSFIEHLILSFENSNSNLHRICIKSLKVSFTLLHDIPAC